MEEKEWKETKGDRIVTPGGQEIYFENDTDTCHLTRPFVIELINKERESMKQKAIDLVLDRTPENYGIDERLEILQALSEIEI